MNNKENNIHILTNQYLLLKNIIDLSSPNAIELDLGCGKGSFTTELAKRYPNKLILAADVMIGRLRKLQKKINRQDISNLELLRVEAKSLTYYMLPNDSIDRLHLLCPDPWPKSRHRHKRLITSDFLGSLYRTLKLGGSFHFASDDIDYYNYVKELVNRTEGFKEDSTKISDITDIKTDFEKRWNEQGKKVNHIAWEKVL